MVRVKYGAFTIMAGLAALTAVLTLPQTVSAMAGRRTVVEFNTFFTVTFAASFVINIALAITLVSTVRAAKRGRVARDTTER